MSLFDVDVVVFATSAEFARLLQIDYDLKWVKELDSYSSSRVE